MNTVEDQLAQLQKKRIINEDDYFDDDETGDKGDDGYQPAPGSPGRGKFFGRQSWKRLWNRNHHWSLSLITVIDHCRVMPLSRRDITNCNDSRAVIVYLSTSVYKSISILISMSAIDLLIHSYSLVFLYRPICDSIYTRLLVVRYRPSSSTHKFVCELHI